MDEIKIYETTNVDVASFLILEGIKLLECQMKDRSRNIVVMRFLDDVGSCVDLERVYLGSDCKKFRDINKYLLKKIHETKRES